MWSELILIEVGEKQIKNTENLFKAIYNDSPIGIELYDSKGKLIDLNQSCMELFGVSSKDDVKGFDLLDDPNIPKKHITNLKQRETVRYETSFDFDLVKKHNLYETTKSGKIYVDVSITPLFLKKKKSISNYLVQIRDVTEYKIVERKLAEEESNKFFNLPLHLLIISDLEGNIKRVNPGWSEKLGYEIGELNGKNFLSLVHPEDVEATLAEMNNLSKGVTTFYFENRYRHKNGSYHVLEWSANADPEQGLIYAIAHDITERKETQIKLKESEEKYRTLIDNILDIIFELDLDGKIIYLSPQTIDMLGYKPEELITRNAFSFIHPDDQEEVLKNQNYVINTGEVGSVEFRIQHKEGHYITVSSRGQLIEKDNKKKIVGLFRDITVRKKDEEKIQYQAKLVEEVSDAIISTDLDFNIVSWNKAAESIYGWKAEEVIEKNIRDIIPIEYPYDNEKAVIKQFFEDGYWRGEAIQVKKDNTPINVLSSVSLIKNITRNPIGAVAVNKDITIRKRTEKELKEREASYKRLAENLPGIVYRVLAKENNAMTFFNDMLLAMTGYTQEELIHGKVCSIDPLIHSEDRIKVLQDVKNAIKRDNPFEVEYRLMHKDGSIRWFLERGRPIKDVDGNLDFIDGEIGRAHV